MGFIDKTHRAFGTRTEDTKIADSPIRVVLRPTLYISSKLNLIRRFLFKTPRNRMSGRVRFPGWRGRNPIGRNPIRRALRPGSCINNRRRPRHGSGDSRAGQPGRRVKGVSPAREFLIFCLRLAYYEPDKKYEQTESHNNVN